MSEAERIADQLQRAIAGPAWHGPSITEILKDVDPAMAAARPLNGAHSIWELLLHVTAWIRIGRLRIDGVQEVHEVDTQEDWPAVEETDNDAWTRALDALRREHDLLIASCSRLSEDELSKTVPGGDYTNYVLLHGVVQHTLYHAGQMAMLRSSLLSGHT